MNRIAFFSLAAFRTPANPWDTRVSLCVECVLDRRMFSLIFNYGQRPSSSLSANNSLFLFE